MKKPAILLLAAMLCSATATAQRTPEHNYDFETVDNGGTATGINWIEFYNFFDQWEPGLSGNLVGISINLCKSIQKELFINDPP